MLSSTRVSDSVVCKVSVASMICDTTASLEQKSHLPAAPSSPGGRFPSSPSESVNFPSELTLT
eukprot:2660712-Rhodomonas_salina.1